MTKRITALILLLPLLAAGTAAMAGEQSGGHQTMQMKDGNKLETGVKLRKVGKDEIGKKAVCPVTGEGLTVDAKTVSASYKGHIYYFCCPGCDKTFAKAPEKYVGKKAAQETVYVCPMGHYQSDKPGKCPKCGMKLVEKKAEKKQEQAHKRYVCPMGDYEGDKPGKCPKCGMNLVEKK
ncbi:MAG: heavy metal-binding domain-containing protein [Elusimicrobia bacterium]|nr:heavy metal-binding domain-containing protein [Elusimicrobiota bacterium]